MFNHSERANDLAPSFLKHKSKALLLLALSFCLLLSCICFGSEAEKEHVRVGFYGSIFNSYNEAGKRIGYAYDYQQDIAAYTGWEYEYVDGDWSELLTMLENGEIDLLSDVSKTKERMDKMLFSTDPMGIEHYYLYLPEDTVMSTEDAVRMLSGKKIGIRHGSFQITMLNNWLNDHDIQAEIIELMNENELAEKLMDRSVYAVVSNDAFQTFADCVPVYEIGMSNIYFVVPKDRKDLKLQLEAAMHQIKMTDSNYNDRLFQNYLTSPRINYLSSDELDWIQTHHVIRVGYRDDYLAFCGTDKNGQLIGGLKYLLDVGASVFSNGTLRFETVPFRTTADALEALEAGTIDCVFPICLSKYDAEQSGLFTTKDIMKTGIYIAARNEKFRDDEHTVVAVNSGNPIYEQFLAVNFPAWKKVEFPNTEACFAGIASGQADCIVLNNYRTNNVKDALDKYGLKTIYLDKDIAFSMAVRRDSHTLLSILNKMISMIPDSGIVKVLMEYSTLEHAVSFRTFIVENLRAVALVTGFIVTMTLVLLFFSLLTASRQKIAERELKKKVQEITALNEKLAEDQAILHRQYSFTEATSRDVIDAFIVDTGKLTSTSVKVRGSMIPIDMRETRPYEETWDRYIDKYIIPEDREFVRRETRMQNVLEKIGDTKKFAVRYRLSGSEGIRYSRVSYICLQENDPSVLVMRFRDIGDIVRSEREQFDALKKAGDAAEAHLKLVRTLTQNYLNVYVLNCVTRQVRILKMEGYSLSNVDGLNREYQYESLCEKYIEDRVYEEDKLMMRKVMELSNIQEILKTRKEYVGIYRVNIEGQIHYYQYTYALIEGTIDIIAGFQNVDSMVKDSAEQQEKLHRALAEVTRANAAKTSFLSRMSHDIRTPLNGILGLIELSERHIDDPEFIQENLRKEKIAANHLLSLINDVLELSKLDDDHVQLAHEAFDLKALFEDILMISETKTADYGVTLNADKECLQYEYPYVFGSPLHVRQIFLNILSNAGKYNRPGGSIHCSTRLVSLEENRVVYETTISDTGIGMSPEFLEHIFEPFTQEKNDARSTFQGTGLGMSIVKTLVDKMNGTIRIESEVDKGSTFVITLPFDLATEQDIPKPQKTQDQDIAGMRILLVEDNDLNLEIAEAILADIGAEVTSARNGREACTLFSTQPAGTYDVILMDIMMPVMDGYAAADAIRNSDHEDARTIPIIAMTANAFAEDVKKCLDCGMDAHLAKPLEVQKLIHTLSGFYAGA